MTIDVAISQTACLVTCSFRGDFEVCRMLCESVDRFVPEAIRHMLFVPAQDLALFAILASARRTVSTQETLLPWWLRKAPLPGPHWRRLLRLPHRNFYLTPFGLPVRGWIAQQIMKISATASLAADIIVHIDSDNVFVRPFSLPHIVRGGRVRLYREPEPVPLATHRQWHAAAGRLLGLPPTDFYGAEYIDQLVVWYRPVLLGMINRIESVARRDWQIALTHTQNFAEYILYGVYADQVVGLESAGLCAEPWSLCHSRYSGRFDRASEEAEFVAALRPWHIACLIQSTIPMSLAERQRVFDRVTNHAAEQDRGVNGNVNLTGGQ